MSIGNLLARKVITAEPTDSLAKAARLMEQHTIGAIVVVEQGRPVGIVTDRDLARSVCSLGTSPEAHLQNVMTCPVATIRWDEGAYNATQQMMQLAVRRLPVVDKLGRLVGLVTLDDLLLLVSSELQNIAEGILAEVSVA
jgi:CBS domain-containing protein